MGLHQAWYAPTPVGAYRMTEAGFGPTACRAASLTRRSGVTHRPTAPHAARQQGRVALPDGPSTAASLTCPPIEGAQ